MADPFPMFVIYDHPTDHPDYFVVRRHDVTPAGSVATDDFILAATLDLARAAVPRGMLRLVRMPDDDPKIVEVWF